MEVPQCLFERQYLPLGMSIDPVWVSVRRHSTRLFSCPDLVRQCLVFKQDSFYKHCLIIEYMLKGVPR